MPIYEFECRDGHKNERIFSVLKCPSYIICEAIVKRNDWAGDFSERITLQLPCGNRAGKIFSVPARISYGKPTIVFENDKTGEVEVAACDNDEPRPGFTKKELSNPFERSAFEKRAQKYTDEKNAILTEKLKQDHSETRKNRHAEINAKMSSIPNDGTREFLKKAMERKSRRKFPEKKSDVKLTINHTDASNLIK